MGKRLDALLGKGFKTSKFKATVNLAISRLAVLKNQRQARCSIAKSDVVGLLNIPNQERALLRVEQVIKEQNMFDVFDLLEGYCHLLIERVHLLEHEKVCPEELKEAVSSMIYSATRCGEFPELQEIRTIFTSRFGKEFAARAVELRNNCGVNPKIIQKLSTRMPSLENKMTVLKQIASDNNIDLPMVNESASFSTTTEIHGKPNPNSLGSPKESIPMHIDDRVEKEEINFSDSVKLRRKYKDVADAAQAAFESAAYAARAARAAVELSRSDHDDPNLPSPRNDLISTMDEQIEGDNKLEAAKADKIHPVGSEMNKDGIKRTLSSSSSDDDDDDVNGNGGYSHAERREVVFDESDDDGENDDNTKMGQKHHFPLRSENVEPLNINRRPISVRTRWTQGR